MAAHVGGALWLTQRVLPGMRERRSGSIVFVSSELGLFGGPSYASYCAAKLALVGLSEVLYHELAGSGVHACAVCPGDVRTEQLQRRPGVGADRWGDVREGDDAGARGARDRRRRGGRQAGRDHRPAPMRLVFGMLGGPRRLMRSRVHAAFKRLLASRGAA